MNGIEVGFIGAGNMATAMIRGITSTNTLSGSKIMVINKTNKDKVLELCNKYGVKAAKDYQELVTSSPVIIIAVKPQQITEVLESISGLVSKDQLVISIAAGIMINMIESALRKGVPVIRAMPNTPAQIGEGVTVLCASYRVNSKQKSKAESIFNSIGSTFWLDEIYMDAVTALSGSGPAYFYRLAQEMTEVSVEMGLDRQLSEQLSRQTLIGAGYLLKNSRLSLKDLIRQIASPQGTTEAALRVFESNRLSLLVEEAMGKAIRRSEEIADNYIDKGIKERSAVTRSRRIVVKIGSSTVTDKNGEFNENLLRDIVKQVSAIQSEGREVLLVSSGAMAAGKGKMGKGKACSITEKQVLAAVGQGLLMKSYENLFEEYGLTVGQVLLTRDDLGSPKRSSLCKDTLEEMLEKGIIPIVNENDTVAVEEIRFGDNDTLSARVAALISADLLILLTDTEGFYNKDPRNNEDAKLMTTIRHIDASVLNMAKGTENSIGTGGMITKVWAANIALENGIPTIIANGNKPDVLKLILDGNLTGTMFTGSKAFQNV